MKNVLLVGVVAPLSRPSDSKHQGQTQGMNPCSLKRTRSFFPQLLPPFLGKAFLFKQPIEYERVDADETYVYDQRLAALEAIVAENKTSNLKVSEEFSALKRTLSQRDEQINTLNNDIKAQNSVISAQNDTITELRNHIKAQNDINAQLRNDIKAQSSVISAQNEKIALLENNVDTLINANILRACQQAKAQEEEEEQEEEQGDTSKDKGKKRQRE
ncbi:hypothetical protein QOT17_003062 [Balamuthia mandrillaris]